MKRHFVISLLVLMSLIACNPKQVTNDSDYDVIVVGGGPAGIGAALASAETGARTLLINAIPSSAAPPSKLRFATLGFSTLGKDRLLLDQLGI